MRRRGFTVMEVLVTLVIVAMFSTAIYSVFLRSLVDVRWIRQSIESERRGQAVLKLLERDLAACVPTSEELPHFVGSIDSTGGSTLEFLSATDARFARDGRRSDLIHVSYTTIENEESDELVKLYRREAAAAGGMPDLNETVSLLDGEVLRFELEYFDGTAWQSVWSEPVLPRAVRAVLVVRKQLQLAASSRAQDQEFTFESVVVPPAGG